jgi:hypothetical protein
LAGFTPPVGQNVAERAAEGLDRRHAAADLRREQLEAAVAQGVTHHDLGRRADARQQRDGLSTPASRMSWVMPGVTTNCAPAACGGEHAAVEHGTGTDAQLRALLTQHLDGLEASASAGSLPGSDATGGQASASGRMSCSRAMVITGRMRALAQIASIGRLSPPSRAKAVGVQGGHDCGSLAHGHQ